MSPHISVLMPVYNAKRYLAEAIESVLDQTFRDFEFVIVDDGSTDGSLDIIQEFAKRDTRIRYTTRGNEGIVRSLNEGLDRCRAEFIARMDADDVCLPHRLATQFEFLSVHPEVIVLGGAAWQVDSEGHTQTLLRPPVDHDGLVANLLPERTGILFVHPTVMMRKSAVTRIGGYREEFRYCEDHDLWLRLSRVGRFYCLPEPVLKLRRHTENVTRVRFAASIEGAVAAIVCHRIHLRTGSDPVARGLSAWLTCQQTMRRALVRYRWLQLNEDRRRLGTLIRTRRWSGRAQALAFIIRHPRVWRLTRYWQIYRTLIADITEQCVSELSRQSP